MSNRPNRDTKTEAIYAAAKKIIDAERTRHRSKTDRLRALRLAKEAAPEDRDEKKEGETPTLRLRRKKSS
jgi:hypothetical protein